MAQIIECIPNFSEGCDPRVIEAIVSAIASVDGVRVLNVDPGRDANRTVVTFAGEALGVVEAAFRGVEVASRLIDMSSHRGAHPRIGATDVLPLVPISGITLSEVAVLARGLAQRIYSQLGIPVYLYEAASLVVSHKNLADCRSGEYESLQEKIGSDRGPDLGNDLYTDQVRRSGASVVGARDYLIAVNYNLSISDTSVASAIASDVRERGRLVDLGQWRENSQGVWVKDPASAKSGVTRHIPGTLKGCKAIGWYIPEYGFAQVSMNVTDIHTTPLHIAYEGVCRAAALRGVRVTGTEIIGLVPLEVMLSAGRYFSGDDSCLSEDQLIDLAIETMNLSQIETFDPQRKIIENLL